MTSEYRNSWRWLSDEELARFMAIYRLRRANFATEMDPEFMVEHVAFLDTLIADGSREQALRQRAGLVPAPPRFDAAFVGDLKSRIALDELCEYELGARLGPLRHGKRRGPCPICHAGNNSHSDPFTVFLTDPHDQHYFCHACQARGDAISAIMQTYGDTFPQAIERLCSYGHLPLPEAKPANVTPLRHRDETPDYVAIARGGRPYA